MPMLLLDVPYWLETAYTKVVYLYDPRFFESRGDCEMRSGHNMLEAV